MMDYHEKMREEAKERVVLEVSFLDSTNEVKIASRNNNYFPLTFVHIISTDNLIKANTSKGKFCFY